MNDNTKNRLCTAEGCSNEIHSKGMCRSHYRLANLSYCEVSGCGNVHYARGYCSRHYRNFYRKAVCKVDKCKNPVNARGYCTRHYHRFMKYGDTSVVKSKKVLGTCKVNGCNRGIDSLGYCSKHYQRFTRHGATSSNVLGRNMDHDGKCSVEGCDGEYHAKGFCSKHYTRYFRYGSPYVKRASPNFVAITCKKKNCNEKHFGKGYCKYHYYRSDYHKQNSQRRRAAKARAPFNDFEDRFIPDIERYFNNCCAYCGIELKDYHLEHVTPLSRGGSHSKSNIVISCPSCNLSKGTNTLEEWYRTQTSYTAEREKKILHWIGCKTSEGNVQLQLF